MPQPQFDTCLAVTIKFEGGFVDDPEDFGGATKWGITQETYDHFRRARQVPVQPVATMTCGEARTVYLYTYYQPHNLSSLPLNWAVVLFDSIVLFRADEAIGWAQQVVGVDDDGNIGPITIKALAANASPVTVNLFLDKREAFHREEVAKYPSQAKFLNGWINRCEKLRHMVNLGYFA